MRIAINTKILLIIFAAAGILVTGYALSANTTRIDFPVAELNNCGSENDCRAYCDKPANADACLNFAEKNNLMSAGEITTARKFLSIGKGPGGCQTKDSCETYCNDTARMEECLDFASEHDLIPPSELEEAKKVQTALKKGAKLPGGCRTKNTCDNYCTQPQNMDECLTFAEAAGLIPADELAEAKKAMQAIKAGAKPPPCRGKKACDSYCASPDHLEECLNFALAAGFISPEEAQGAQKTLQALKKGVKPLPCRGQQECDEYCSANEHFMECLNFAEAAGFMSPEEAAMARKTGGKGPGGCRSKKTCDTYCAEPEHQDECFEFAKERGLLSPEEIEMIEKGRGQREKFMEPEFRGDDDLAPPLEPQD